ncbi:RICIN domain-containing protein [Streptomyces sp. NPDC004237]|uniref:RICIN domain-containing protein n=1 Tax=Streptomyces sp. NPDC004237 TaxID=3154455 RepID=UPI0033AAE22F
MATTVKSSDLGCSDLSYAVLTPNSGFSYRLGNTANGNPVQLYWCNDTNSQQWTLQLNGTVMAESKCMAVTGGGTANGTADYTTALTRLQISRCTSAVNQRWNIPT